MRGDNVQKKDAFLWLPRLSQLIDNLKCFNKKKPFTDKKDATFIYYSVHFKSTHFSFALASQYDFKVSQL